MNFNLKHIPSRPQKPRESGCTMMMDKGLSTREAEDFVQKSGEYTDVVKFGFGTAVVSNNIKEKIKIYQDAGIRPYFGGTLLRFFLLEIKYQTFKEWLMLMV